VISMGRLLSALACPVCHGRLELDGTALRCTVCDGRYAIESGIPRLFHPNSVFAGSIVSGGQRPAGRVRRWLDWSPKMTTWVDETVFKLLNESPDEALVLNLGSGHGLFDGRVSSRLAMINLDVQLGSRADLLADGHYLPFRDESLDAVFSNAVLEHVARPWIVCDEIRRVIRPGGRVFVSVPFLNIIHDTHDYFRFSDKALEVLFAGFEKVAAGVSAGGGSFIGPFLVEYALCFVPGTIPKRVGRRVLSIAASPLKYLDFLIRRSPQLRITADAFYYVGLRLPGP
jgi:SAM-dependent methyltransferase/uncharacterized protein YbaR (Trm112 family)